MNLVVTLLVGMLSIRPTDSLSLQGCGEGATSIRGRIVGGKLSRQGMWPWQVGIHKQSIFDSSRYNIICGGALIAPQWVLTAAHCFYTRRTSSSKIWHEEDITSLKRYKIIAGDIDTQIREISEQERFPIEVYIHPGYRHDPYYENDIALVKLNQTVTLSPLVRTVCLPISDVDFAKPGTVGTVAGWGRTRKSLISTVLKHTTIGIKDNAICKKATTYFFNKTVTFCAGDGNGRNDTCQGDSGGSLVRSVSVNGKRIWVTVGLVSWGEGCGLPGKYGYYTRVHSFVDWINSSMLSCGNPGNIPFGRLIKAHRMKRFPIDFRVKYKCIDGYVLKGKSGRKCKGEGSWTRRPVCVRECGSPLGMENRNIPDKNIRASSRWNGWYDAVHGRLNGGSAWCSGLVDRSPYLEIDLSKPYKITYVATQGLNNRNRYWVSKYIVSHNLARSSFIEYREASKEKLFTGNSDATSIVKHKLKKPFIARKIRFLPLGLPLFGHLFKRACMRVEIYGCDLPIDCVMVGSRVLGRWRDYYDGGDIYYKAIVRTSDSYNVQLEIEDENHHDDSFKSMPKTDIVLDVPNKQLHLPSGTRVLMPWNNKYYTGTIGSRWHQDSYEVYPDYSKKRSVWRLKKEIHVLKSGQFCE